MHGEWWLILWSAVAVAWGGLSWMLAIRAARPKIIAETSAPRSLSIFKPLPPLGGRGLTDETEGLESFIAQLEPEMELLLGIHEADRLATNPFVDRMQQAYPAARLKVIHRTEPDTTANRKIAWQKILAPHAKGELWFWSDVEIIAPAGFLRAARTEYERSGRALVTFPYVIDAVPKPQGLLDALFVNLELYPGLLLLRKLGPVDFGLGAGLFFSRADFEKKADWDELGASLADDFILGQQLRPVQLSRSQLTTKADAESWRGAMLHHLRWSKTIWWNRPVGSAARIIALPVLGWLAYVALHPARAWGWTGLVAMIEVEVVLAVLLCQTVGCRMKVRDLLWLQLWSFWRVGVWCACWFPWPVNWRGQIWRGPKWIGS